MSYRVLHVLDHSAPVLSGYSVRSRSLITAQHRLGFQPEIVTGPLHELDDPASAETQIDGVPVWRTRVAGPIKRKALERRVPVFRELTVVRLLQHRIEELLATRRFDLVHAHSPALCGLAAVCAARKVGIPTIYEIRAFWEDAAVDQNKTSVASLKYRAIRNLEGNVVRRADAVVGIAKSILQDLRERGIDDSKLFHVSNGVDRAAFPPTPKDFAVVRELGLREDEPVFGFIGSLYRYEGLPFLVRAVAELRRRGTPAQLLVIGAGEDANRVNDTIAAEGAADYVKAIGKVPPSEVRKYYAAIDFIALPRLRVRLTELVTPLKPLEAMAQEKPVIASRLAAIEELVADRQTGLLFEPENIDDFCQVASELIRSAELRSKLISNGRRYIVEEKDWAVLARRYTDVYDYALNPRKNNATKAASAL